MSIVPQLIANSLIAAGIYALVALGFSLGYRTTKFFNLTHGTMAVVGGYVVYYFYKLLGWNLYMSVALGVMMAAVLGYLLNKFIFAPLRARRASNLVLLVASLGAFTVIQALIAIIFTSQFQTLSKYAAQSHIYELAGAFVTQTQIIMVASAVIILAALALILKFTLFGKAVKAIGDDEKVAEIIGINTNKIIGRVLLISAGIAGWAGILIGFDTGLEPAMGMRLLLKGVVAVIVGGAGSIYGAVVGALILGFAENFGIWKISGEWKDAIAFVLLIVFLLFRPQGIVGRK